MKARATIKKSETINPANFTPKELFYILSNYTDEDIFDSNFCENVIRAHPDDRYLIFHTMMVLINHPKFYKSVNSIAKQLFVLNTGSVFHTISLSYIIAISSNEIRNDAGQYLDRNTARRMMEPVLGILREIWRSIIQGDLYIAVNATYNLSKYVSMYTPYLKQKQRSSDMLYKFVKYVSFDYSQLDIVSDEDLPKKELSELSNGFSMPKQPIVTAILSLGAALNVAFMLVVIALTVYSIWTILAGKTLLYDACDAIEAIFLCIRCSCLPDLPSDVAAQIIHDRSTKALNTKFFTKYVNSTMLSLFATSCYQLAFENLTFFIETGRGRHVLNQTAYNVIEMVNAMTTAINKFIADTDRVGRNAAEVSRFFYYSQAAVFVALVALQGIAVAVYRGIIYRATAQVFYFPREGAIKIYNKINGRIEKSVDVGLHLSTVARISISVFGSFVAAMLLSAFCMSVERASIGLMSKVVCSGMTYHSIFPPVTSSFLLIPMLGIDSTDRHLINASSDSIVILHRITAMSQEPHQCTQPYTGTLEYPNIVGLLDSPLYPLSDFNRTFRFVENINQIIFNLNIVLRTSGHNNTRAISNALTYLLEMTEPMAGIKTDIDETEDFEIMKISLWAVVFMLMCVVVHICVLSKEVKVIINMQNVIKMETRFVSIGDRERGVIDGEPNMSRVPLVPPDVQAVDSIPCAIIFFRNGKVESQNETAMKYYGDMKNQTDIDFNSTIQNSDYDIINKMCYKGGTFPRKPLFSNVDDPFVVLHDVKRITLIMEKDKELKKEISNITTDDPTISGYSIFNNCIFVHILYQPMEGFEEALERVNCLLFDSNTILVNHSHGEINIIFYGQANTKAIAASKAIENGFAIVSIFKKRQIEAKCAAYFSRQSVILGKNSNGGSTYIFSTQSWVGPVLLHQASYGEVAVAKEAMKFVIGHQMKKRVQYAENKYHCECYIYGE